MKLSWIGLCVVLMGCVGQPGDRGCEIGRTLDCTCSSGLPGTQTCQSDGIFGECQCVSPPQDTQSDSGAEDTSSGQDTSEAQDSSVQDTAGTLDMGADSDPDVVVPPVEWTWSDPYASGATSYVTRLVLDAQCCFDFGDRSKNSGVDNAFGRIAAQIEGLGIDFKRDLDLVYTGCPMDSVGTSDPWDDELNCSVCTNNSECSPLSTCENGTCTAQPLAYVLLDHHDLDDAPDTLLVAGLAGQLEGAPGYEEAASGQGSFVVDREVSFVAGTTTPQVVFNPVRYADGEMSSAEPSSLPVLFPFLGLMAFFDVEEARFSGPVDVTDQGVTHTEGELSGYVTLSGFLDSLNVSLQQSCGGCFVFACTDDADCFGAGSVCESGACSGEEPVYRSPNEGDWLHNCPELTSSCSLEVCTDFIGEDFLSPCEQAPVLLRSQIDIDTNNNDIYDALSIGFRFRAVPATVTGVSP